MLPSSWLSPAQAPIQAKDEVTAESTSLDLQNSLSDTEPVSLEGFLYVRRGKSSRLSSFRWKRRFVFFNFDNGGSISVWKESPYAETTKDASSVLHTVYSKLHRSRTYRENVAGSLEIDISSDLPWLVKDVENDPSLFVVEIDTNGKDLGMGPGNSKSTVAGIRKGSNDLKHEDNDFQDDDDFASDVDEDDDGITETVSLDGNMTSRHEIKEGRKGKPLRIYFRCDVGTNEKALWLKAFSNVGRLSRETRRKKSLLNSLTNPLHLASSRVRSNANELIARDARHLDLSANPVDEEPVALINDVEFLARGNDTLKDKEFRVLPTYAYPHRWLTKSEMKEEMVLPSEHFHDLRIPGCRDKEIGSLKVEVLQCLGLPKLDRGSDTDAIVYLVCGSYAFASDVISNRTNPMWLRKTRRACIFPIFHGYASLYVGVFDDEPRRTKDDFAGRVVVDLARLRPRSSYDVTLPLRLSTHVYSRRSRGAIRLRFSLNWTSERDALLSYIPKKLPPLNPQFSEPNYQTTVMCTDQKAFRNIAITVHGAHLPGRFTFNQMRAAIREINFTRKYVFTAIRKTVRETRQWQNPAISTFVFLSWMHCVYSNAFSLVPAYIMLFFVLFLMRNYARFGSDGPGQRGFIPPSWEELFMALVRGGDRNFHAIEPLELGVRPATLTRQRSPESMSRSRAPRDDFFQSQFKVTTHKPKGKKLFQALGLSSDEKDPNEDHIEFAFANGKDYPKFTVRESLVQNKTVSHGVSADSRINDERPFTGIGDGDHHNHYIIPRFPLDMDLQRMMRKDSSGTKDYDEEEDMFNPSRAVITQAASKMTKTATALSSKTGLDYVVRPIHSGISSGVEHISSGVGHMSSVAGRSVGHMTSVGGHMTSQMMSAMPSGIRRRSGSLSGWQSKRDGSIILSEFTHGESPTEAPDHTNQGSRVVRSGHHGFSSDSLDTFSQGGDSVGFFEHGGFHSYNIGDESYLADDTDFVDLSIEQPISPTSITSEELDPALIFPEQNIDIQGPNTGKKLTDDLAEIKDKMHELTWHMFDDHAYVIKNADAVFFGDAKKPEKWRKADVSKQMDKYLHIGQYSHSNPFVARVGMYVEPIIGSSYSILCCFRAGFNVATWRDPILTFWLSFICAILSIVLFIFPWRLFLFIVGVVLVGPQNWAIRVLREQGHLPPAPKFESKKADDSKDVNFDVAPTDKPIFTRDSRKTGNDRRKPVDSSVDPREIHHVVVPYNALTHQRCNDWPPEPQYAQVTRDTSFDDAWQSVADAYPLRRDISHASSQSSHSGSSRIKGMKRLRRTLRRRQQSRQVSDLPPIPQ